MFSFNWFIAGPLVYFAVALFIFKTAAMVIKYLHLPRHLRWDLYPVPHQEPDGSKYQKVDFFEMEAHKSHFHEIIEMGSEILFIKRAYINNPKVWRFSYPLHMGLYLGFIFFILLITGAVFELNDIHVDVQSQSVIASILYYLIIVAGVVSFMSGLFGSVMLLWMRLTDEGMKSVSDPVSYFNLVVMMFLFGTGLAAWGISDSTFTVLRQHMTSLITLNPSAPADSFVALQVLACCIFLIYLPFSRMMHFVGKYFFYHTIMWDDEMLKNNKAMQSDISAYLQLKTSWSAPHIHADESWETQVAKGFPKDGNQ